MTTPLPHILIVEDDDIIRMLLCEILSLQAASIRAASDGQAALQMIQSALPTILISDLHMPIMSGFELLAIVRQHYPQIHVIATSGAFCGPDIPPGVAADAYYEKTSGIRHLIGLIERCTQNDHPFVRAQRIPPQSAHQGYQVAA